MDIQITGRHEKVSPSMKETILEKISRREKFHEKITSCHVIIDSEHTDKIVEIVMNIQGQQLSSKGKSDKMGAALEDSLSKIERQLKKSKEKVKSHKAAKPSAEIVA